MCREDDRFRLVFFVEGPVPWDGLRTEVSPRPQPAGLPCRPTAQRQPDAESGAPGGPRCPHLNLWPRNTRRLTCPLPPPLQHSDVQGEGGIRAPYTHITPSH
eukprot:EG_transcript_57613